MNITREIEDLRRMQRLCNEAGLTARAYELTIIEYSLAWANGDQPINPASRFVSSLSAEEIEALGVGIRRPV